MELDAKHGTGRILKTVSIFAQTDGELRCNISGSYPRRAVAAGDAAMSETQLAALDAVQRLASSPDMYLDMDIGEGDIQFLNNRTILHGRTGYTDWPEVARRRHLMRLWLEVPSGRACRRIRACTHPRTSRCGCASARPSWSCRRAISRTCPS